MKAKYSISSRIQTAMQLRNMSQADIVRKTGINKGSMCQYVSGDFEPKSDRIHLIADALNVDPVWLAGFDVPMEVSVIKTELSVEEAEILIEFENNHSNREFLAKYLQLNETQKEAIQNIVNTMVGD